MKTNTIATLYNHYTDKATGKTMYKKTIIDSVNWQRQQKTNVTDKGLVSADQINVLIPFYGADFEGKTYIEPKAYRKLSDEEKDKHFTFDNNDYIVRGEVNETNIEVVKKSYDNVATIISVLTCDNGSRAIRHWEIGCK